MLKRTSLCFSRGCVAEKLFAVPYYKPLACYFYTTRMQQATTTETAPSNNYHANWEKKPKPFIKRNPTVVEVPTTAEETNQVLRLQAKTARVQSMDQLFKQLQVLNRTNELTHETFSAMVQALINANSTKQSLKVYQVMTEQHNMEPNVELANYLLLSLTHINDFTTAKSIYERMLQAKSPEAKPNVTTINLMLKHVIKFEHEQAKKDQLVKRTLAFTDQFVNRLLGDMHALELKPDLFTYNQILSVFAERNLGLAEKLFRHFLSNIDVKPNVVSFTTMIDSYVKKNQLNDAITLFNEMQTKYNVEPNVITYTAVIECHCRAGDVKTALTILDELKQKAFKIDDFLFNKIISGYARIGDIDSALQYFTSIYEKYGVHPQELSYATIFEVCIKENKHDIAEKMIIEMIQRNFLPSEYSTNRYVHYLCTHDKLDHAIELFKTLRLKKMKIPCVVYELLMDNCGKQNRLEEMQRIFKRHYSSYINKTSATQPRIFSLNIVMKHLNEHKQYQQCLSTYESFWYSMGKHIESGADKTTFEELYISYVGLGHAASMWRHFESVSLSKGTISWRMVHILIESSATPTGKQLELLNKAVQGIEALSKMNSKSKLLPKEEQCKESVLSFMSKRTQ